MRKTASEDPLAPLRLANLLRTSKYVPLPERALSYYERHPEHRPRKQSRRQLRRRVIRGG
jgi:hypothetical protein